jgi:ferredoxin
LQHIAGKRKNFYIYGADYDTPDSTCIRDYIHVTDLVKAHSAALEHLEKGGASGPFNLGIGRGFSVLEIIKAAEEATGGNVDCKIAGRRPGDPPVLVASVEKAREILNWEAEIRDPVKIIKDAWKFYESHPNGYNSRGLSEDIMLIAVFYKERCKGCGLCAVACPKGIISMCEKELNQMGYHPAKLTDPGKCIACGMCVTACPDTAVEIREIDHV